MITETFTKRDRPRITAVIIGFFGGCAEDKEYTLEIKERKRKRSLDSNAYAWTLMDKLAAKTGVEKTEIYCSYIREIGGNSTIVCVQNVAVQDFRKGWQSNGIGWVTDTLPSKLPGCTNVICYYGSSTYDQAQMSRLIDMIVQDCKEQDIETMTPREIAAMNAKWEAENGAE